MTSNYLFLLYLFGISTCLIVDTVADVAIIGGHKARVDQFPYQVSLQPESGEHDCGGAIIDDRYILTAAHCVLDAQGTFYDTDLSVVAGTIDLNNHHPPAVRVYIEKIYVPVEFWQNDTHSTDDIAVLKLEKGLGLFGSRHLRKLKLPINRLETYAGKTAVIAGFGWDWLNTANGNENGGSSDDHLRYAETLIHVQPRHGEHDCPERVIQNKQICARVKHNVNDSKPKGVCTGDSGSALVYEDTAIGILSMGPYGCNERDEAATYTRVSHYMDFIRRAMLDEHHASIRTYSVTDE